MAGNFKKYKSRIIIINGHWYVINGWKGIRGGMCHAIRHYAKANNRYMKDYDKNKESTYLKYWDVNYLYGWAMSQKLPVNNFE